MEEKKKMTYEELENVAHQLSEQSRQLYSKLQQSELTNVFKRLDYLFKVLEFAHHFSEEFTNSCAEEIRDIITVPEEQDNTTTKE